MTGGAPIRLLVVDDHEMFVDLLARRLDEESEMEIVATAMSGADAVDRCRGVDVVLCDYGLPDLDGVDVIHRLHDAAPGVQVVILTSSNDEEVLLAAIAAGCAGFVSKTSPLDEVITAIRAAAAGESMVAPAQMARLLARLSERLGAEGGAPPRQKLTAREHDVLREMAKGGTNQAIADDLFISVDTVRNHVASILRKLGCHSKLEAVTRAARLRLIDVGKRT